jgi:hypothetical protein
MMQPKAGEEIGWFSEKAIAEMTEMTVGDANDGWHEWTGAFRMNPSQRAYTLVIRPREGVKACTFEYKGKYEFADGKWSATRPELVKSALGSTE